MRFVLPLSLSLVLGGAATAVQAAPALPTPNSLLAPSATAVDWHPSTSHWDHHFHSHPDPSLYAEPAEAERRVRRGDRYLRNPEWSGYPRHIDGRARRR